MAAAALALGVLGAARAAEARLIDFRAGVRAGGLTGWGSDSKTPDFFNNTAGGAGGFELGAKLLIFDASVNFLQTVNSSGLAGTLTQFQLGIAIDVPIGTEEAPGGGGQPDPATGQPAPKPEPVVTDVLRPSLVGGVGFGTNGPVHGQLNNDEVSDKGLVGVLKIGYEHFLNPLLGVGVEGDIGYHYFLGGQVVTTNADHSSGVHIIGLATLTFHLGY
jgi:hypothetical protein